MKSLLKYLAGALVMLAMITFAPLTHAQGDIFGVLSGKVADSTGALIPGVTITITNEATKLSRVDVTDSMGFFTAPQLQVGRYTVKGEKKGFKAMSLTGIDVNAGSHATADLTLQVGAASEEITVESAGETINTQSAEMSATVDSQQVADLALNERNYVELTTLIAGAATTTFDQSSLTTGMSTAAAAINGMRQDQNLFTVDGGYNNDSGSNGTQLNNVGIDFVSQVSVQASNFSAEYGRNAAASINVVTKSGGARFHGSAFEFDRNNFMDAASAGSKLVLISTPSTPFRNILPSLRYNDFGWSAGGPIIRNKLFFFGGQEYKRTNIAVSASQLTVPTSAERGGNFSDMPAGFAVKVPANLTSLSAACKTAISGLGLVAGNTFPSNTVPAACITTDGAAIASVYALMSATPAASSFTNTANSSNVTYQPSNPSSWREDIIRIDYHPAAQHLIYFRYIHDNLWLHDSFGTFYDGGTLPTVPTMRMRPGYTYQLGHIWTINSHMINEAKGNASWNKQRIPPLGNTWERSTYGFQFPLPFTLSTSAAFVWPNGIPHVSFSNSGMANTTSAYGTAAPSGFDGPYFTMMAPTTDITGTDTFTWEKGHHTLKFGGMFARNRKDQNSRPNSPQGAINFQVNNPNTTGDPFADALMGNFQSFAQQSGDPIGFFRFNNLSIFAMDNWKVAPRLSFELGLRYERTTPTYSQQNNMTNFDPSTYSASTAPTSINGALNTPVGGLQDIPPVPGVTTGYVVDGLVRSGAIPSDQLARVPNGSTAFITSVPVTSNRGFFNAEGLFAPRLGVAFTPNPKTSVRAGFGLFFDKPEGNIIFGQPGIVPFLFSASFTNGLLANPSGPGGSTPTLFDMSSVDPKLRVSRTAQYSLSVQNESLYGVQLQAAFVGNMGRHLLRQPNINQPSMTAALAAPSGTYINQIRPYLGYGNISQFTGDATSNYNGLQLTAEKRRGALTTTINYTWSKVLSQISGEADNPEPECAFTCLLSGGISVPWKQFYTGSTNFDRRQILVATYTLTDPLFKNQHNLKAAVLGGWSLSGITRYQTGAYLTVTGGVKLGALNGSSSYTRRANMGAVSGSYACPAGNHICNFDPTAYSFAPVTSAGTAPIGNIVGPSYFATDLSMRKAFGLWKDANLMLQGDAFNVFNRTNWSNPGTGIGGSLGWITASNPPRQMQVGAKITF
jgi:outer membrane receptor protein involved in Fe transport